MPFEIFFSGRLKVKVTGVKYELVRAISCTIMHGFQNNFAQFLSSRRRSDF